MIKNYLRNNGDGYGNVNLADRYFNDGEAVIMLNDLERIHQLQANYLKQRSACVEEIRNNRDVGFQVSDMNRLISERDNINQREQGYINKLGDLETFFNKKIDIERRGLQPPEDLMINIRDMINVGKVERAKILEQKREFSIKFEQKRQRNDGTAESRMVNVANSILNPDSILGTYDLKKRTDKIAKLKQDHRETLLNDFIRPQNDLEVDLNKDHVGDYVRGQLDKVNQMKDKGDKLRNINALRSSMEMVNGKSTKIKIQFSDSQNNSATILINLMLILAIL